MKCSLANQAPRNSSSRSVIRDITTYDQIKKNRNDYLNKTYSPPGLAGLKPRTSGVEGTIKRGGRDSKANQEQAATTAVAHGCAKNSWTKISALIYLRLSELALPALSSHVSPHAGGVHPALEHVERDRGQLREHHIVCPGHGLPPRLDVKVVPPVRTVPNGYWRWWQRMEICFGDLNIGEERQNTEILSEWRRDKPNCW